MFALQCNGMQVVCVVALEEPHRPLWPMYYISIARFSNQRERKRDIASSVSYFHFTFVFGSYIVARESRRRCRRRRRRRRSLSSPTHHIHFFIHIVQ